MSGIARVLFSQRWGKALSASGAIAEWSFVDDDCSRISGGNGVGPGTCLDGSRIWSTEERREVLTCVGFRSLWEDWDVVVGATSAPTAPRHSDATKFDCRVPLPLGGLGRGCGRYSGPLSPPATFVFGGSLFLFIPHASQASVFFNVWCTFYVLGLRWELAALELGLSCPAALYGVPRR